MGSRTKKSCQSCVCKGCGSDWNAMASPNFPTRFGRRMPGASPSSQRSMPCQEGYCNW